VVSDTESKIHFIRPELRAYGGLFIGEIKSSITMSQLSLTDYCDTPDLTVAAIVL
jgi:hypothetical protein